jgi:16S rRNA (guanine966-N2)-methyltransferase
MMKNKPLHKSILSGKFKGKKLLLPSLSTTRSSKTIVLESFFNTLQFDIIDAVFVEVFSGSGSIGLEALSRGASRVYFMEKDKNAFDTLQKNIKNCDENSCICYKGDSFQNIIHVIKELKSKNLKAYFYIDPPFSIREGHEQIYNKMLDMITSLDKDVVELITIEHMSSLKLEESIGCFEKLKSKKFGNTTLTYFE